MSDLDAFLDALDERLGSYTPKGTFISVYNLRDMIRESRAKLAEEPAPEMPEGWWVEDRMLHNKVGAVLGQQDYLNHGPDTIRAAVEAWLKEMERR